MGRKRDKRFLFVSLVFLVLIVLLIIALNIFSASPQILSASVYPEKITAGQAMLIKAEIKDSLLIKNAKAEIETDDLPDITRLLLVDGSIRNGKYEKVWIAHDTSAQKWYNITITATNIFGKTASKIIPYQDPTQSHNASEIVGGTFTGNYTFAGTLKSLDNNMVTNNVISMYTSLNLSNAGYTKLKNGVVDAFRDQTGINTGACANQSFSTGYYTPNQTSSSVTQQQTTRNDDAAWYSTYPGLSQGFKTSTTDTVTKFEFMIYKFAGATGTLTGYIYSDDGSGLPNTALATFSTIDVSTLSESSEIFYAFTGSFTPVIGTQYHIVVIWTDISGTIRSSGNTAGGYADGQWERLHETTWEAISGRDAAFKIYQGSIQTKNMTLISNTMKALTAPPTQARITLFEEDVDAVTLNTDLKAFASRDDGTSWTQATLTNEGNYTGNIRILSGTATISSQPSGTDMKWNVTTYNGKNLKIRGVGLLWE
jgi:hypothetical protein